MTLKAILPYAIAGAAGAIVATLVPALISSSQAESRLLPFQGRLTDADGSAIVDGARVVEFKMYDAPTGGSVKWAGEVHRLSVNGGLVNTMLGSKASLGSVDFAAPTFLQITVDANGDGAITATDPPLLPRQSVVPAVFAFASANANKLAGHDWSSILAAGNDPTASYIATARIGPNSISSSHLSNGSVGRNQIQGESITSSEVQDGSITLSDVHAEVLDALVPAGSITAFGGAKENIPRGWLLCDGRGLSRSTYSKLFAAIGSNWGDASEDGDPSTDFRLPDLRGMFLRGASGTPLRITAWNTESRTVTVNDHGIPTSGHRITLAMDLGPRGWTYLVGPYYSIYVDHSTLAFSGHPTLAQLGLRDQIPGEIVLGSPVYIIAGGDDGVMGRASMASGGNTQWHPGSVQEDAMKTHAHELPFRLIGGVRHDAGSLYGVDVGHPRTFTGNSAFETETRPRNTYVHYIIRH